MNVSTRVPFCLVWLFVSATACDSPAQDDGSSEPDVSTCSDGVLAEGEACDDGNTINGDGCNSDCRVSGSTQWCFVLPQSESTDLVNAQLAALEDGVLIGATASGPSSSRSPTFTYLDPEGAEQWTHGIDIEQDDALYLEAMVPSPSGSSVTLIGRFYVGGSQLSKVWIASIDADGVVAEPQVLTQAGELLIAYTGAYTGANTDEGLLLGGRAADMGWIAKLGPTHELVWERAFAYDESTMVTDILGSSDGRVVVVGTTKLPNQASNGQSIIRGFVRVHRASGDVESERLLPIEDSEESLEVRAVGESGGKILIGGARSFGPDTTAQLWSLDFSLEQVEVTLITDSAFSGVSSLATTPEGTILAAGFGSESLPVTQALWAIESLPTNVDWTFSGQQGEFSALALSTKEPAVYAGGVDLASSGTPLTVCKVSR